MKKFKCLLVILCVMALSLPLSLQADDYIDITRKGSITFSYYDKDLDVAIEGASFDIYRVADVDVGYRFELTGVLSKYANMVGFDGEFPEDPDSMAIALYGYILTEGVQPDYSDTTDSEGKVTFSDLSCGLYLAVSAPVRVGDYIYTAKSVLIAVPSGNPEKVNSQGYSYEALYDITSEAKFERRESKRIDIEVQKIWDDDNDAYKMRPVSIKVALYNHLGDKLDEVVLDSSNNWRYKWEKLDPDYSYSVVEVEVTKGYVVTYGGSGNILYINNRYFPETPPTTPPPSSPPDVPNTGILWWPVPVMGICGLGCCFIGFLHKKEDEEEQA